jgi:hypothetical protein
LAPLGLDCSRVNAEPDLGVQVAGAITRFRGADRGNLPHREPAMLIADLVLKHPTTGTAGSEPNAKTRNVVIESDLLSFARLEHQSVDGAVGQLHGIAPHWEDHGKIAPAVLCCPVLSISCTTSNKIGSFCAVWHTRAASCGHACDVERAAQQAQHD